MYIFIYIYIYLFIYIYIYLFIYIYIYYKTSIKRNNLTIKVHREVGQAKDLSAPLYVLQ